MWSVIVSGLGELNSISRRGESTRSSHSGSHLPQESRSESAPQIASDGCCRAVVGPDWTRHDSRSLDEILDGIHASLTSLQNEIHTEQKFRSPASESSDRAEAAKRLKVALAATPVPERRQVRRRCSESLVDVLVLDEKVPDHLQGQRWLIQTTQLHGKLIDVSANGAAFLLPEPLHQRDRLLLHVKNRENRQYVEVSAHVLRVHADPEGGWKIVCRFDSALPTDQLTQASSALCQPAE